MKTSEFFGKFASTYLWANVAGMVALVAVIVLAIVFGADWYTNHGEKVSVPDVRKHLEGDAVKVLENLGFVVEVVDTDYVKSLEPGMVLEQTPLPGAVVKPGRIIYLTINAIDVPTKALPDIIDNSSYREARARLEALGLKVGEPQYVPGEKDWVYGIKVRGRMLSTGMPISVDDVVIIMVGSGKLDASDTTIVQTRLRNIDDDLVDETFEEDDFDDFEVVE